MQTCGVFGMVEREKLSPLLQELMQHHRFTGQEWL